MAGEITQRVVRGLLRCGAQLRDVVWGHAQVVLTGAEPLGRLTFTAKGVVAEETAGDPDLVNAIRAPAREVIGFLVEGMPAMMHGMMGPGDITGPR